MSTAINMERLTIRMSELEAAWTRKNDASESYSDVVKVVAAECAIEAGALKAYINAKMRDKLEKAEKEAEQLQFLFESL